MKLDLNNLGLSIPTGLFYSTAFSIPSFVEDIVKQFEVDLKDALISVEPPGGLQRNSSSPCSSSISKN
jgi:hypothetical protein